jgi:hypothetical protein
MRCAHKILCIKLVLLQPKYVCEQLALTDAVHCPCCIILFVYLCHNCRNRHASFYTAFVGSTAVTAMLSHGLARDRQEAIQLGNAMLVSTKAYCKLTVTYFVCFTYTYTLQCS